MKNPFTFLSDVNFKKNIKVMIDRFAISVIIIIVVACLFFILVHTDFNQLQEENILRIILSCIITFFLSIGVYIGTESLEMKGVNKNSSQLIPIVFGLLFYLGLRTNFDSFENIVFFILSLAGIISFMYIAPYLKVILNGPKQSVYYSYFYRISVVFLISFILGGILFLLGMIGITAVFELFELRGIISDDIYSDWAIISLVLLTPVYALTQLPEKKYFHVGIQTENVFFSFLVKYIATPFIYIYFIILYAYSVKVLFNFGDWPRGEVSWLVIGFSIFGYLVYIFSYIFEKTNKFIKVFRKVFPYAVIPQLFMLFYAISLRINQYDITINRYFVVVFGLFLASISIYFVISKKKRLVFIPLVLTLYTIIISIGPWSVYSLPETRQLDRLKNNLIKADILQGGKIIPLEHIEDISQELSKNIYSGIQYVCNFDNCKEIKKLFWEQYQALEEKNKKIYNSQVKNNRNLKYFPPRGWDITSYITEQIKVRNYFPNNNANSRHIRLFQEYGQVFPISISGYNELLEITRFNTRQKDYAKIDSDGTKIDIMRNGIVQETLDISFIHEKLLKDYMSTKNTQLSKDQLIFQIDNFKILFQEIYIENPLYSGNDKYDSNYTQGYLLIK